MSHLEYTRRCEIDQIQYFTTVMEFRTQDQVQQISDIYLVCILRKQEESLLTQKEFEQGRKMSWVSSQVALEKIRSSPSLVEAKRDEKVLEAYLNCKTRKER